MRDPQSSSASVTGTLSVSGSRASSVSFWVDASVEDGLLDVVVIRAASRLQLVRSLPRLYDGSHVALDEVLVLRGRSVTVSSDGAVTAYTDGERLTWLPVTARVVPRALQVLVAP